MRTLALSLLKGCVMSVWFFVFFGIVSQSYEHMHRAHMLRTDRLDFKLAKKVCGVNVAGRAEA